jgi:hypothetical protein
MSAAILISTLLILIGLLFIARPDLVRKYDQSYWKRAQSFENYILCTRLMGGLALLLGLLSLALDIFGGLR